MPTFICVRCKQVIPDEAVQRDANGQIYHAECLAEGAPGQAPSATGVTITEIRVPFSTVFQVTSQVLGVIALWSLVGWIFLTVVGFLSGK